MRDRGTAVFFSTHILEIAERMCDRVVIINKGEIVASGTLAELRARQGQGSLEDIFLRLTGGTEYAEMAEVLGMIADTWLLIDLRWQTAWNGFRHAPARCQALTILGLAAGAVGLGAFSAAIGVLFGEIVCATSQPPIWTRCCRACC